MNFFNGIKNLYYSLTSNKKIVFYFENSTSEIHFKGLLDKINNYIIITSDKELQSKNFKIYNFFNRYLLVFFFTFVRNRIIVMTTPDLENFYLKKNNQNRYIYVHHSICSTHMIYNSNAFDHYDYIFNVGNYQNVEIRKREELYKLKNKKLLNYGYGKLDYLINNYSQNQSPDEITIAPSWNKSQEYLISIDKIITVLIDNFKIRFRPHKASFKYHPKDINKIISKFSKKKNFILDLDDNSFDYILNAKYFITDWSGSAFEYAFFNLRPVIFLDTQPKVNNLNFKTIDIDPVEIMIRDKMGLILKYDEIDYIEKKFHIIDFGIKDFNDNINTLRKLLIFNLSKSSDKGKIFLKEILDEI